jgi:hypothetical protein
MIPCLLLHLNDFSIAYSGFSLPRIKVRNMATGTGNLPHPGMSFSPFAILTAEELNDIVENVESVATGIGLGDNSVPKSAIKSSTFFNSTIEIQQGTATATSSAANTPTVNTITYPKAFSGTPNLMVFYQTSGGTADTRFWGSSSTTTTGTYVWSRTNNSNTTVWWIAIYSPVN